jgi:hypothetical protein
MLRLPPAEVILPKFTLVIDPFGSANWGVLKAVKNSARNWRLKRSPMRYVRLRPRSKVFMPGLRRLGSVREPLGSV